MSKLIVAVLVRPSLDHIHVANRKNVKGSDYIQYFLQNFLNNDCSTLLLINKLWCLIPIYHYYNNWNAKQSFQSVDDYKKLHKELFLY